MPRAKKVAIVLLLIISLPAGLILFSPNLLLTIPLRTSIEAQGYELVELRVSRLSPRSTTIDKLVLSNDEQEVDLSDMVATYSVSGILAGRVNSIDIAETSIRSKNQVEQSEQAQESSLAEFLQTFDGLALDSLNLESVHYEDKQNGIDAAFDLQSPPLKINGSAKLNSLDGTAFEFQALRTSPTEFKISSTLLLENLSAATSSTTLNISEAAISIASLSTVRVDALSNRLAQLLPSGSAILNDELSLSSEFNLPDQLSDLALVEFSFGLDSPNSMLQLLQDSDLGRSTMQVLLPISLEGEISNDLTQARLSLSKIYATGSWALDQTEFHIENTLEDTSLYCSSRSHCDLESNWQSNLVDWSVGEYSGTNLRARAPLRLNYSNEEMRLATELVQINVPSLVNSSNSIGMQLSTNLQLDEVELRVGDVISGGFNIQSSELSIENEIVEIVSPAYSGKLQLEEDVITGILEFDLNQNLRLGIGLQHFLLRDTGDVVLQLAAHEFSESEPLSSLLAPKKLDADIVAGSVEGLANISWSKQRDESWRFGGPIALKLDQLSGYYADYFFVDLSTDMFAEATTPLGIQVTNPASASLGRVDIGLPLENLSWQYRFDSLSSELRLNEFNTGLLGGKLSIPTLEYRPSRDRQQIDVVVSDLSVEALVALAEYPGLTADGLLSGYLPFVIDGDSITIEEGLVGALNPGGSIRYIPASASPSTNSNLQLVNDALSNYQYRTMNTEVFYDEDGELLLEIQLQGNNPDMNNGQEINLNVNITDNIPSLLKSLQASRVITDELERLVNRP